MASQTQNSTIIVKKEFKINPEYQFYILNKIMTIEELKRLIYIREYVDASMVMGLITADELYRHIKFELKILDDCQKKIAELKRENTGEYDPRLTIILSNRIHDMFTCLFILFPYKRYQLIEYCKYCSNRMRLYFTWTIDQLQQG